MIQFRSEACMRSFQETHLLTSKIQEARIRCFHSSNIKIILALASIRIGKTYNSRKMIKNENPNRYLALLVLTVYVFYLI